MYYAFFKKFVRSLICSVLVFALFISPEYSYAQSLFVSQLPEPGMMVSTSPSFTPVLVKGLVIHPDKPLNFDFIVDSGNAVGTLHAASLRNDMVNVETQNFASLQQETLKMAKYFLAAITVPEDQLWVNLSPYEKDRMIENDLGQTVLGRDMLAQDYLLKQLTASLIYPEKGLGKEFWSKVYEQAQAKFGTTDIPVDTFNKVWIMPEKAEVFEKGNAVYVTQARLKVMLDSDYKAMGHAGASVGTLHATSLQNAPSQELAKVILRQVILPALEKEVNEGQNFASIRQIFHAAILAKWYRGQIQNTLLANAYVGTNKVDGVTTDEKTLKEEIYARYIAAYKKGVFNYIKDDDQQPLPTRGHSAPEGGSVSPSTLPSELPMDTKATQVADRMPYQDVPRQYFSGGEIWKIAKLYRAQSDSAIGLPVGSMYKVGVAMDNAQGVEMGAEVADFITNNFVWLLSAVGLTSILVRGYFWPAPHNVRWLINGNIGMQALAQENLLKIGRDALPVLEKAVNDLKQQRILEAMDANRELEIRAAQERVAGVISLIKQKTSELEQSAASLHDSAMSDSYNDTSDDFIKHYNDDWSDVDYLQDTSIALSGNIPGRIDSAMFDFMSIKVVSSLTVGHLMALGGLSLVMYVVSKILGKGRVALRMNTGSRNDNLALFLSKSPKMQKQMISLWVDVFYAGDEPDLDQMRMKAEDLLVAIGVDDIRVEDVIQEYLSRLVPPPSRKRMLDRILAEIREERQSARGVDVRTRLLRVQVRHGGFRTGLNVDSLATVDIKSLEDGQEYGVFPSRWIKSNLFTLLAYWGDLIVKIPSDIGEEDFVRAMKRPYSNEQALVREKEPLESFENLDAALQKYPEFKKIQDFFGDNVAHYLVVYRMQYDRMRTANLIALPETRFVVLTWVNEQLRKVSSPALVQQRIDGVSLWEMFDHSRGIVKGEYSGLVSKIGAQLRPLMASDLSRHIDWNIQNFVWVNDNQRLYYVDSKPSRMASKLHNEHNREMLKKVFIDRAQVADDNAITQLKQFDLISGLHTTTGGKGFLGKTADELVVTANILKDKGIAPVFDNPDALKKFKVENPGALVGFFVGDDTNSRPEYMAIQDAVLGGDVGADYFVALQYLSPATVKTIKQKFPNLALVNVIGKEDGDLVGLADKTVAAGADAIQLKPMAGFMQDQGFSIPTEDLKWLQNTHPNLLIMGAGAIFGTRVQNVIAAGLVPAVGFQLDEKQDVVTVEDQVSMQASKHREFANMAKFNVQHDSAALSSNVITPPEASMLVLLKGSYVFLGMFSAAILLFLELRDVRESVDRNDDVYRRSYQKERLTLVSDLLSGFLGLNKGNLGSIKSYSWFGKKATLRLTLERFVKHDISLHQTTTFDVISNLLRHPATYDKEIDRLHEILRVLKNSLMKMADRQEFSVAITPEMAKKAVDQIDALIENKYEPAASVVLSKNSSDEAMNGGIDIKNFDVNKTGASTITFNEDAVRDVLKNGFNGFTPVIINITPIASPLVAMGITDPAITNASAGHQVAEVIGRKEDDQKSLG